MSTPLQNPDAEFVAAVVQHLKSKGYFDSFRKECLSDCDTRVSFCCFETLSAGTF